MTFSKSELLNTTTLKQLLLLQAKIPEFLQNQLLQLNQRWPCYIVELTEAIKMDDVNEAADLCHKIKGHSGMLGFQAILDQAEELEAVFRQASTCHGMGEVPTNLQRLFVVSVKEAEEWLALNSLK